MVSLLNQENLISWELINTVVLLISYRVNGPNLRPTHKQRYMYKEQEEGVNVEFKIWLMNSTKG